MPRQLVTIILILVSMAVQGQINGFDSVANKLQFHVFTDNPDSCVLPFLQRCAPILAKKLIAAGGGWTMYPPGPVPIPQEGLLSIKVTQHPSLHCRHSGARFDILTQEWKDGPPGIKGLRVWFYFDNKADAENALKTLIAMFKGANTTTKTTGQAGHQIVMLYENGNLGSDSGRLILRSQEEGKTKYSILFAYGSDRGETW